MISVSDTLLNTLVKKKIDFGSKMSMLWTKKLKPEVGGQIACFLSKMNVIENFT